MTRTTTRTNFELTVNHPANYRLQLQRARAVIHSACIPIDSTRVECAADPPLPQPIGQEVPVLLAREHNSRPENGTASGRMSVPPSRPVVIQFEK